MLKVDDVRCDDAYILFFKVRIMNAIWPFLVDTLTYFDYINSLLTFTSSQHMSELERKVVSNTQREAIIMQRFFAALSDVSYKCCTCCTET